MKNACVVDDTACTMNEVSLTPHARKSAIKIPVVNYLREAELKRAHRGLFDVKKSKVEDFVTLSL
jgi:hypothetical protein